MMLLAIALVLLSFWGAWRTLSYELTGKTFPCDLVWSSESSRKHSSRDGEYMHIWRFSPDAAELLSSPDCSLASYPLATGRSFDGYVLVKWKRAFGENQVEKQIVARLAGSDNAVSPSPTEDGIVVIHTDEEADVYMRTIMRHADTQFAYWYICHRVHEDVMVTDYILYMLNPTHRCIVACGDNM